jgi:Kdo2-lipid IVA lauroyltransferase/acyltransferase
MGNKISYVGSAIFYYLVVYPISLLPLRVIYVFTDILYFILTRVTPYRKRLIRKNLFKSFPQASHAHRKKIKRAFYQHLCDLLAESIKNISISERELKRRFKITNYSILNKLYAEGKDVLLVSGHYNNWEWMITAQNILLRHQAAGIGMPLSNAFWNKKLNERRARFGMEILNANNLHAFLQADHPKPTATLVLSDQAPGDSLKSYWMNFLNQKTPVFFGCEQLAHQYNSAVVYFVINKRKRGYYKVDFQLICESASDMYYGEITEKHTKLLERAINKHPEFWLWSHNRWKRHVPEDLEALRAEQQAKFEKRFPDAKKKVSTDTKTVTNSESPKSIQYAKF